MISLDIEKRWSSYRKANSDKPEVRDNELQKMFVLLDPKPGEKIWEAGTGNGYLTFPLAHAVGNKGEIVSTDISKGNITEVISKNKKLGLKIEAKLLPLKLPLLDSRYNNYFDSVATIATLHHFDNRKDATGETYRRKAIGFFYDTLKKGGKLVMSDPLHGTITQKYFDSINNPQYCYPDGHPHDFFTKKRLYDIVKEIGFSDISIEIASTPWKFESRKDAVEFVHTIHNAKCSPTDSFKLAEKILGFKKVGNHYELGWELFFLSAVKK